MWAIYISTGQAKSLSALSSNHFNVITFWDYSEHETYYFSSPHLSNIPTSEPSLAFFRAKALLRILNGILMLDNQPQIVFDPTSIDIYKNYDLVSSYPITHDSQLEYKELQEPFQKDLEPTYNENQLIYNNNAIEVDFFELAYNQDLIKEVLILFSLSKVNSLYILTNASKIVETIDYDLDIPKKEKPRKQKIKELKEETSINLSIDFWRAFDFFKSSDRGGFSHFVNTRDGSGIFARHGASKETYKDKKGDQLPFISFEKIEENLRTLMFEWINYRLLKSKGYRYPLLEKKSRIVELSDDVFDFDL